MKLSYDDFIKKSMNMWLDTYPHLYNNLKHKINKTELAILNLLTSNKNILYISNDSSRNRVSNAISYFDLFYLFIDFDEEIAEDTFFNHLLDDFNYNDEYNSGSEDFDEIYKLNNLKQISKTHYSNLNLLPQDIKLKKDNYLDKLDNHEYIFPIKNSMKYTNKSLENSLFNIKYVLRQYEKFFKLDDSFSKDFFETNEYKNLIFISDTFNENLNEFININKELKDSMDIAILENINSIEYLEDIDILIKGNNNYINLEDRNLLNEFLKTHYCEKNNLSNINFPEKFKKIYGGENLMEQIEKDVLYSQLIDSNLFNDIDKIKFNLFYKINDINYFIDIGKYLKKQLYVISKFYYDYDCFDMAPVSFNVNKSIEDIKQSFNNFQEDLILLKEFTKFVGYEYDDDNVKLFVDLVRDKTVDENLVQDIFYFNVYNDILNNFLNEYNDFDENNLDFKPFEEQYNLIKSYSRNQLEKIFVNSIKSRKSNNELILNQKEDLCYKLLNNDIESVKDILTQYPECFMDLKRVCLMSEKYISCLNSTFNFDYVLIDKDIEIDLDDEFLSGLSNYFIIVD